MESAKHLLSTLHQRDVDLWVENGQLRLNAPKGVLCAEDVTNLRALKVELIQLLEQAELHMEMSPHPRLPGCPVPLTAAQRVAWRDLVNEAGLSKRVSTFAVRIIGSLNVSALRDSLEAIVRRHESLRTRIVKVDGIRRQHIDSTWGYQLEVVALSGIDAICIEKEVKRLVEKFVGETFDLAVGPLFLPKLFKLSDREYVLILGLDHMITDGFSNHIINAEIWTSYNQALRGLPIALPRLPLQFADYAVWHQRSNGVWRKKHEAFWKGRLIGAPRVQIPTQVGLMGVVSPNTATLDISFGDALSAKLRNEARRNRTLLSLLVLTIYIAVISRWCEQRDLVVGCICNGRCHSALEKMVGFLAHTLLLRIELSTDDSFLDLLGRVNLEFYSAYDHNDFDRVFELTPECSTELFFNWTPPFGVRFTADQPCEAGGGIEIQPFRFTPSWQAKFLTVFFDTDGGIVGQVAYRPELFALRTIEQFAHMIRAFAEEFVQRPLSRVVSISVDGKRPREQ